MTGYYIDADGQEQPLSDRLGPLWFIKDRHGALLVLAHDEDGNEIGVTWQRKGHWRAAFHREPGTPNRTDVLVADDFSR